MYSAIDTVWVLTGAVLVFAMQAGFAMLETGFSRTKNASNVAAKNVVDFLLGSLAFWVIGFGLMYAGDGSLIGGLKFFASGNYVDNIPNKVFVFYQLVFCATSATIASGALSGRMKFSSYCIYSVVMSGLIYPISGHWAWGGGFLQQLGFHDFAGGGVVHMAGGIAALAGAMILGPRLGKYNENRTSNAIQGHSMALSALGVFILWIGWFGFNGSSTMGISQSGDLEKVANIFMNTALAGAASGTITLLISWFRYHKADISMTLNGILAGLVAITAGCDVVTQAGAVGIGIVAALVMVAGIEVIDLLFHIDDPVGASSVHGLCGIVGVLMTGFLSTKGGLLHAGGTALLKAQAIGALCICAWVFAAMSVLMLIMKYTIGIRVDHDAEIVGLDRSEHGYSGSFMPLLTDDSAAEKSKGELRTIAHEVEDEGYVSDYKVRSVVIITRENKLNDLKNALNEIGISGITVSSVMGCGVQKGHMESYYRGVEVEVELIPKVRVEVVISEVPLQSVIEVTKKVLKTGNVGDGKIFVYDVDNVIRIRTEEEGVAAL